MGERGVGAVGGKLGAGECGQHWCLSDGKGGSNRQGLEASFRSVLLTLSRKKGTYKKSGPPAKREESPTQLVGLGEGGEGSRKGLQASGDHRMGLWAWPLLAPRAVTPGHLGRT